MADGGGRVAASKSAAAVAFSRLLKLEFPAALLLTEATRNPAWVVSVGRHKWAMGLNSPYSRFPCSAESGSRRAGFSHGLLRFCCRQRASTPRIKRVDPTAEDPSHARQPGIELRTLHGVRSKHDFSPCCRLCPQTPPPQRANRSRFPWPSLPWPRLPLRPSRFFRLR